MSAIHKLCETANAALPDVPTSVLDEIERHRDSFWLSCRMGHLKLARYLADRGDVYAKYSGSLMLRHHLFAAIAAHGHLEMAKWFTSRFEVGTIMLLDCVLGNGCFAPCTFRRCCDAGQLEMLKWIADELFKLPKTGGMEYRGVLAEAFKSSVETRPEVAMWLKSRFDLDVPN